jgi:hypothetical protein
MDVIIRPGVSGLVVQFTRCSLCGAHSVSDYIAEVVG